MNDPVWLLHSTLKVLRCAVVLMLPAFWLGACDTQTDSQSGKELVATHCTGCHSAPLPGQLPREAWPTVLKWMGSYLGVEDATDELGRIVNRNLIPDEQLISSGDFSKIERYFLSNAKPRNAMFSSVRRHYEPTSAFDAAYPVENIAKGEFITMVRFDAYSHHTFVGFGTENNRRLEMYNKQFDKVTDLKMKSEPIHLAPLNPGFRLSLIGDFFFDEGEGEVLEVRPGRLGRPDMKFLIAGWNRMTQSLAADFNQDGRQDLLVVGFGQGRVGRTSVVHQLENGHYGDEVPLWERSGSLNAAIRDFDGNGYPDVMLLVAQEHQKLLLFLNRGKGQFEKKLIHEEAVGFGYNHFTLADFNDDDRVDIVTSNGNNMELPDPPLKPHHGIRVLLNQGDLTWKEKYFFPMHGAIESIADDFDRDGDVDIAAIAFYPDWEKEFPTTFVYLENNGSLRFTASTIPSDNWGRWMVMDSGDVNGDGYRDLILGAAYIYKGVAPRHTEHYEALARKSNPLLFLYNTGGKDYHGDTERTEK